MWHLADGFEINVFQPSGSTVLGSENVRRSRQTFGPQMSRLASIRNYLHRFTLKCTVYKPADLQTNLNFVALKSTVLALWTQWKTYPQMHGSLDFCVAITPHNAVQSVTQNCSSKFGTEYSAREARNPHDKDRNESLCNTWERSHA